MFVFSFKATTLKYIGVMSLCAVAIALTVSLVPSTNLSTGMDNIAVEVSAEDYKNVKTNENRRAFLKGYGWETDEEPVHSGSVTIPYEFDELYSEYNKLQKKEGLDLEKYKGKTVEMYVYKVTNADGDAYASLLIYKNRVVGGDVSSSDPTGFRYSFSGE